jgi:hypothetical protein
VLASDLLRAGYAQEVTEPKGKPVEPELAALEPAERTTMGKGRRRKGGGL